MIKRVLTLDNALKITSRIFVNDDAGPSAGCTAAPARTPVQNDGTGCRCSHETPDHGCEFVVAVTDGRLDGPTELAEVFGTWERIFYGEFDGRRKRVLVKIIGE